MYFFLPSIMQPKNLKSRAETLFLINLYILKLYATKRNHLKNNSTMVSLKKMNETSDRYSDVFFVYIIQRERKKRWKKMITNFTWWTTKIDFFFLFNLWLLTTFSCNCEFHSIANWVHAAANYRSLSISCTFISSSELRVPLALPSHCTLRASPDSPCAPTHHVQLPPCHSRPYRCMR